MSVRIPYKIVKNSDEAYKAVKANITKEEIAKWNVNADIFYDDAGKYMSAKGSGFEITFNFDDDSMVADAKMGFLLTPLKNKILGYIEHKVKKVV